MSDFRKAGQTPRIPAFVASQRPQQLLSVNLNKIAAELRACVAAAQAATEHRLVVNIGHDLNLENLPPLVSALPSLAETSIGHELTADALEMGFERAVIAYKAALRTKD